jgi:hypothetical protein
MIAGRLDRRDGRSGDMIAEASVAAFAARILEIQRLAAMLAFKYPHRRGRTLRITVVSESSGNNHDPQGRFDRYPA